MKSPIYVITQLYVCKTGHEIKLTTQKFDFLVHTTYENNWYGVLYVFKYSEISK